MSEPGAERARILVLNERDLAHPKAGGAEIHVAETFRRLAARGYPVTLASSSFAGAPQFDRDGELSIVRLGELPFYYLRAATLCARGTRAGSYDVVVECLNKVPFYAPLYSAVPVLALCHHLFGETAFLQVAWPLAAAVWTAERGIPVAYRNTSFIAISESSRDDLVARGIGAERIRISHCGVQPPAAAPERGVRPLLVSYVGRLEPYKRVDLLLRAMGLLAGRFPEAEIVIMGRGQAQAQLERVAHEVGVAERTRFTGFISDAERDALLARSRVCVCPSVKEGWGMTVIEANALGAPVVASDAPGLRDSVRDGDTGFLVSGDRAEDFADRIGALLADDELATTMSDRALAWAESFDWDRAADEMAEAVEAVRQGRGR